MESKSGGSVASGAGHTRRCRWESWLLCSAADGTPGPTVSWGPQHAGLRTTSEMLACEAFSNERKKKDKLRLEVASPPADVRDYVVLREHSLLTAWTVNWLSVLQVAVLQGCKFQTDMAVWNSLSRKWTVGPGLSHTAQIQLSLARWVYGQSRLEVAPSHGCLLVASKVRAPDTSKVRGCGHTAVRLPRHPLYPFSLLTEKFGA